MRPKRLKETKAQRAARLDATQCGAKVQSKTWGKVEKCPKAKRRAAKRELRNLD